jgi:hypothetical protein
MIEKRRINAGNYRETGSRFFNPWSVTAMEHVMFIFEKTGLSALRKLILSISVALIFTRRFGILVSILFAYVNRKRYYSSK